MLKKVYSFRALYNKTLVTGTLLVISNCSINGTFSYCLVQIMRMCRNYTSLAIQIILNEITLAVENSMYVYEFNDF